MPFKGMCYKAKTNRIIEVNYKLQEYKRKARERLTSEKGIYHRGKRCIEPEAVFAQIKHNSQFNRFSLRSLDKVKIEFTLVAIAHNLRKWTKARSKSRIYRFFIKSNCLSPKNEKQKRVYLNHNKKQVAV